MYLHVLLMVFVYGLNFTQNGKINECVDFVKADYTLLEQTVVHIILHYSKWKPISSRVTFDFLLCFAIFLVRKQIFSMSLQFASITELFALYIYVLLNNNETENRNENHINI